MRQSPRAGLIFAVFAGIALFHPQFRSVTLILLRMPFVAVKSATQSLLLLPRLPRLSQDNAALRKELVQRQMEVAELREALRRTEQGRELMEHTASERGVIAAVIGRSTLPIQQTVLLDRGGSQGLTMNSVIVDANGLIGRVIEVHPADSLVLLLTDPDSRVAGLVDRSREMGLLVGSGGGRSEFIYLDVDADIQDGDRIVTAGLGGPFPKGLFLGTVTHVTRDELTGSARASVAPAARLGRLEEVLCLPGIAAPPEPAAEEPRPPARKAPARSEAKPAPAPDSRAPLAPVGAPMTETGRQSAPVAEPPRAR